MNPILDNGVTRRGFLRGMAGILAAGVAPAAIGSNILMPVRQLWIPDAFKATGGTITTEGAYTIHTFHENGEFVVEHGVVPEIFYKCHGGTVRVSYRTP